MIIESVAPERSCDQTDMGGRDASILDHEWQVIRIELGQRRIVALRRMLLERKIDVRMIDDFLSTSSRLDGAETEKEELSGLLLLIWNSLAARPVDCVLLSVFMYARCHSVWELNGDHDRIEVGIQGLLRSWERAAVLVDSSAWLAVDLVVAHAQSLLPCARVEDALRCSCPVAMAYQANLITTECGRLLARSAELSPEWAGFRKEFLTPLLRTHQLTYHSLVEAADSVTAWAVRGRAAAPEVHHAMQVIEQAERDPDVAIDLYANELRGHRAGLSALHARITDPRMPDLRIEHAKIVYCYPFFIPGLDSDEVCQQAQQFPPGSFGQGRFFTVAKTELSDIWDAQEKQEAEYRGVTIGLPDLEVKTTSGDVLADHAVTIRLSRLGNHYIRIEKSINDCSLHELNQAMRRAAPYMGLETITEVGGAAGPWQQIPTGYVRDLAARFCQLVQPESNSCSDDSPALATDADFHVVVEITAATVINDDGLTRLATTDDILAAAGPLLSATLQRLPSTLEEWTRFGSLSSRDYGLPPNLADSSFALPGDFIGQTPNSTFIVMLNTPNWAIVEHEERAEFVASLRPLIEGWRQKLTEVIRVEQKGESSSLSSEELLGRRQELQDQVRRVQNDLALLHSIDLWKTLSSRRIGESLYEAAGLADAEAELKQTITRVELYYERMAVLISQNEEHHDRRYRKRTEVTFSILGLLSLADSFGLVNQLFGFQGWIPAATESGIFVAAVAIVIVLMVYKGRDQTRAGRAHQPRQQGRS